MPAFKDITGQRFGRLTVIRFSHVGQFGQACWLARCDCGVEKPMYALDRKTSCGCQRAEKPHRLEHGHTGKAGPSPTYRSWMKVIQRCTNPKSNRWSRYGGRGIAVCKRWLSFKAFLEDVGERPAGKTIDRVDNDGNYEPGNVRWATPKEQVANRRH
jgi:hypothetical protein